MFEVSAEVLKRDPESILAHLGDEYKKPPKEGGSKSNEDGDEEEEVYYFERDWWI